MYYHSYLVTSWSRLKNTCNILSCKAVECNIYIYYTVRIFAFMLHIYTLLDTFGWAGAFLASSTGCLSGSFESSACDGSCILAFGAGSVDFFVEACFSS